MMLMRKIIGKYDAIPLHMVARSKEATGEDEEMNDFPK